MKRQGISSVPLAPSLGIPVQDFKGVGPKRAHGLARLGVQTVADALYLVPLRHEDRRHLRPIRELRPGFQETVVGEVKNASVRPTRRRFKILSVIIGDGTGTLVAKWFHQPYLKQRFPRGQRIILSGKVSWGPGLEMVNPDYEEWEDGIHTHTGRIVPIYPLAEGLFQRWLRGFMKGLVEMWAPVVQDFLPDGIRHRHGLTALPEALRAIHFPERMEDVEAGKRRLAYDDLLLLSLGVARRRQAAEAGVAAGMVGAPGLEQAVRARLGFSLTAGQERVLEEIKADMARSRPMTRLLQGDVGCGKTAVALLAMVHAVGSGFQGAIMAPTEILAEQHRLKAEALLTPVGIRVGLLSGGTTVRERERLRQAIAVGELQVVIGTHALLQETVSFHRLGFVIVDEQHRFGVKQRAELTAKGVHPHTLVMTATPIPRTLALTLYGDLNFSIIDELPPGRQPVKTELSPEGMRLQAYRFVLEEVRKGGGAYVICPLVEENEETDLKAATSLAAELQRGIFQDSTVGCLHGRMRTEEKRRVMDAFREGKIQVLVATTVVEVGMDVPRARVVVVEHADRLGLTQLHQIRGRVGRAQGQAYCILIHGHHLTEEATARLQAMVDCADGFQIAERDLELRGPGELFGTRQAGFPGLDVAHLFRDVHLIEDARREASRLLEEDPDLAGYPLLRDTLRQRWEGTLALATVG
ncbi:MAG: ATP-dependent DNA helicase RecG [Candidatus Methylomirabilales bacterium]|nr:ATP-dependent DNA helicase RecG [candidate division NC10 bacterium]MCH7895329.1 ATP-dependent DNA helicase RecG [candidate division NC10 bacterium]MCZ6551505.1 ATP-dependent DNA helicase RecG [candidate division NC10 bacterium]